MSRRLFTCLIALTAVVLSACVNAPTQLPGLGVPEVNPTHLFAVTDVSARPLDCLSGEIRAAGADDESKITRIALGAMPNTVGAKVGRVDLPPSLQPFVRVALDRISSGIAIIDEGTSHIAPLSPDQRDGAQPRNLPVSSDPKDIVQFRLNGSIYTAAPFRVLENELQAFGFGAGTRVDATDIGIQLYWQARVSPFTFQQSGTSVSMMVRVYSAEQGASAFRVMSGSNGLILGRSRAAQEATPHFAIQSAVNLAVGMLVKARASRDWGVASACQYPEANTAVVIDPTMPTVPLIDVRLMIRNGEVCAVIAPTNPQALNPAHLSTPAGPLQLEVIESRNDGIEIRRRNVPVPSLHVIFASQRPACFPRGAFDVRTTQVQFFFKIPGGRSIGSGSYFF